MNTTEKNRIGFHYYPDTIHYRTQDLLRWLPELKNFGASWLTLLASNERAIPEPFLAGLIDAGIQPILHFPLPVHQQSAKDDLQPLFHNYARWGVRYIALYDRPNSRHVWSPTAWAQPDLVERFLDMFIPQAESALQAGLLPIFPPMEPGGDYWDLAFLNAALHGIRRRGHTGLLENLILGAYAWVGGRALDWGVGGPDRWPGARPYHTPPGVQDQRGFRIFDWYLSVAEAVLARKLPVILLRAGSLPGERAANDVLGREGQHHAEVNLNAARLISADPEIEQSSEPIPQELLACNFWLLAAESGSPYASQAWFKPNGENLPVVNAFRRWATAVSAHPESNEKRIKRGISVTPSTLSSKVEAPRNGHSKKSGPAARAAGRRPIGHYILLPSYAWGAARWDLDAIQPLLQKSRPTVGFSLLEASLAERVTVVGGGGAISDAALETLRSAGCQVDRLQEDGTIVAT